MFLLWMIPNTVHSYAPANFVKLLKLIYSKSVKSLNLVVLKLILRYVLSCTLVLLN